MAILVAVAYPSAITTAGKRGHVKYGTDITTRKTCGYVGVGRRARVPFPEGTGTRRKITLCFLQQNCKNSYLPTEV